MGNTSVKPHPKPRNKKQVRWKAADRPSAPGKPSLFQENGLVPDIIHICWSKPEKDGGSSALVYHVEHKRLGSSHWMKANTVPVLTNELAVNDLEAGWRYQFRVRAENAVGLSDPSEASEPFTVTLKRSAVTAPKFTQDLIDLVVLENGKSEFDVHFLGQPTPNICWFKDGFEIFSSNRTRITTVSDRSVLTILQTVGNDQGEIKCTATNKAGHASTKAKLTIEAPPSIRLPKTYQDQDGIIFEIGETIRLNVFVTGRPTPLVFWSHDGETVRNDDRHELEYIDKTAIVKIENALRTDRGEYQIRAVNKLGQDMASFLVTITDKPTPPGRARVLLTSGRSVTLSWSTPEDDGGCKIGNYIIEYYRVGWDVWLKAVTSRQLTTMLCDLIEGSEYKFRVKAESPYGVSEPSEESETVFIPDPKRGIEERSDIRIGVEKQSLPQDVRLRRRASSSPRVSFALDEDKPKRPERKKTGKTPEASPRLKRKQIPSPAIHSISSQSLQSNDVSFAKQNFQFQKKLLESSPTEDSINTSKTSVTSPLIRQLAFSFPEGNREQAQMKDERVKTKSPSPEIVVSEAMDEPSPELERKGNYSIDIVENRSKSLSPMTTKSNKSNLNDSVVSKFRDIDKIRPSLVRQQFSGSSEFMLVLCPEGEQGAQLRTLGMSFEENSMPPPLSLSAPELGVEPPELETLKRSSSSTELLNYRLMERMHEDALEEEELAEMERNEELGKKMNLEIPTIQVNSKPTQQLVGLEKKPALNRRFSTGGVLKRQSNLPPRRQSLKNSFEMTLVDTNNLHKFDETDESRREIAEYKQESIKNDQKNEGILQKNISLEEEEDWMKDYEESIPSEEETESSADERRHSNTPSVSYYKEEEEGEEEEEEETYNPRQGMLNAKKVDDNKPFEILTVRKEPPDSNLIPKPILKKKQQRDIGFPYLQEEFDTPFKRNRSLSLVDSTEDPRALSLIKNRDEGEVFHRDRSGSLKSGYEDTIDVNQLKKSPNLTKRRSFSLIPSQANFIKEAFKSKNKEEPKPETATKVNPLMNVSALANFTSIAGAGLVIPDKMIGRREAEEEAKSVVDFYGDIVKSFGSKHKPSAEFSRTVLSKYDTYEERKISEIRENLDVHSQDRIKPQQHSEQGFKPKTPESPVRKFERQDTPREKYSPKLLGTDQQSLLRNQDTGLQSSNRPLIDEPKITSQEFQSHYKRTENVQFPHRPEIRSLENTLLDQSRKMNTRDRTPSPKLVSSGTRTPQNSSRSQSRSSSINRRKKPPRSRDASTSPVRFENWDGYSSSRNSLERDYYDRGSLTSSRASSLTRRSPSPMRPKLRAMTTQTSFRIEPKTPAEVLEKQKELANKAEKRMKGVFEYFTDLAMISVASWLYLFYNEYLAIPVLLILVYRQLSEKVSNFKEAFKKRIPKWIRRKGEPKGDSS